MAPQKLFQSCSSHSLPLSQALSLFSLFSLFVVKCPMLLSLCLLSVKKFCVNCFQVISKFYTIFFSLQRHSFLKCKQADKQTLQEHLAWSNSTPTYSTHTYSHRHIYKLHKNMHTLFIHLQTPPLSFLGTELCHLFKCSLIVWPQGSPKTHIL